MNKRIYGLAAGFVLLIAGTAQAQYWKILSDTMTLSCTAYCAGQIIVGTATNRGAAKVLIHAKGNEGAAGGWVDVTGGVRFDGDLDFTQYTATITPLSDGLLYASWQDHYFTGTGGLFSTVSGPNKFTNQIISLGSATAYGGFNTPFVQNAGPLNTYIDSAQYFAINATGTGPIFRARVFGSYAALDTNGYFPFLIGANDNAVYVTNIASMSFSNGGYINGNGLGANYKGNFSIGGNASFSSGQSSGTFHVAGTFTTKSSVTFSDTAGPTVDLDATGGTGNSRIIMRAGSGATNRASNIDIFNAVTSNATPRWRISMDYLQSGQNDLSLVHTYGDRKLVLTATGSVIIGNLGSASLASSHTLDIRGNSNTTGHASFNTLGSSTTICVYDTGDAFVTKGIVLNQSTSDDKIITLKSADVSQPATTYDEADTYFSVGKYDGDNGGVNLRGMSDGDNTAVRIDGWIGASNPTDSVPAVILNGRKSDGGTAVGAIGLTETVLKVMTHTTDLVKIYGSGLVENTGRAYAATNTRIHATLGNAQVFSAGVPASLAFNSEVFDDASEFASSTFTCAYAGKYRIHATAAGTLDASSYATISIYKDGVRQKSTSFKNFNAGGVEGITLDVNAVLSLAVGEKITITVQTAVGGCTFATDPTYSWLDIVQE